MITWNRGQAVVDKPIRPLDDARLLALLDDLGLGDRAGVDCPFGWPVDFVAAVAAHARGQRCLVEVKTPSNSERECG
jgi:hypothetical protein